MPIPQSSCPVCASGRRHLLPTAYSWNKCEWRYVRCECSHEYVDPVPNDDEITRMYDERYFSEAGAWVGRYWEGSYIGNEANLRRESCEALAMLGAPGRLLELGCAGGFFLDEARKAGFDVIGVELNEAMARHARERLKLDVRCCLIEEASFPPASFNYVVAQDVLEHLRDVRGFVSFVAGLLAPDGALVIRGPLHAALKSRIYETLRRMRRADRVVQEPPYHLQGFTPSSFRSLMRVCGLEVDYFEAKSVRAPLSEWSVKEVAGAFIESIAYVGDVMFHGGGFMQGRARRSGVA